MGILLSLLLLALASRLISGVGVPKPVASADPAPDTAFGSMTYISMTDIVENGLDVWEFNDPSCPGPLRILKLPLSGEIEPLSEVLRQPSEDVTYWYGGTIYNDAERLTWLFRYALDRIRSLLHVINRGSYNNFYLKIFRPAACAMPPTADWTALAAAIHQ
jgi:hypothetical protein